MTYRLNTDNKIVGMKQVERALDKDEIQVVYIALDADDYVTKDIIKKSKDKGIDIIEVETMEELGEICNIDINAAVAALLK